MVITNPDGSTSAWGSWRDHDTAAHLAGKLREKSSHYGGDGEGDYSVTLEYVDRWPGLANALAELNGPA